VFYKLLFETLIFDTLYHQMTASNLP